MGKSKEEVKGILTQKERLYVASSDGSDRKRNFKIRWKSLQALQDLALISQKTSSTWNKQKHKIFREALIPSLTDSYELENGSFSKMIGAIVEVCFVEGRKMVDDKMRLEEEIQRLKDGMYRVLSSEGWDKVLQLPEEWSEHPLWKEQIDNALLLLSTQILNPVANALEEKGICVSYEFSVKIE